MGNVVAVLVGMALGAEVAQAAGNDATGLQAAIKGLSTGGGTVALRAGVSSLRTGITLRDHVRLEGQSVHGTTLVFTGTGKAIDFESTVDSNTVLSELTLRGNAGAGDHCIEWRNSPRATSSASFLQLRDVRVEHCPAAKAAVHFLGIKPAGGEGNVYGALLLNTHLASNLGTGLWLDSQSAGGAAGTALTNVWASSVSGNAGYGILFDTSKAPASRHGITNVFGTLLQGNGAAAIRASSVGNLNLIGSYFEQVSGQPQISAGEAVHPNGPFLLLGNAYGNGSATPPAYNVDLGAAGGNWGSVAVISQANTTNVLPGTAVYNISRLNGGIIGPDVTAASGSKYVNWPEARGYRMVQVFDLSDGSWSFSSDGSGSDQPHVGFGVKNTSIAAYVDMAGRQPPQVSTAGANAFPALRVTGAKGGNTSGAYTGGKGGSITLTGGDGGDGVTGSTTGEGGDVTITPGARGRYTGAGVPGADGHVVVNRSVGQGTGIKHGRVTTGRVAAGARASVTLRWGGTAFADTNYTVTCSVLDGSAAGAALSVERVTAQATGSVTVQVRNSGAASLTGAVHCLAMHD